MINPQRNHLTPSVEEGMDSQIVNLVDESLKKPFTFNIDIVDRCNLRCVQCPRGINYRENTLKEMHINEFKRLLDKLTTECECKQIELLNWTEPFLHPELDKFVSEVKGRKIGCVLSSNLSFRNPSRLESVLMNSPALIVSVSGFTQKSQERYHRGSRIEYIKSNLKLIEDLKKKQKLLFRVEIHCLQFIDNEEDQLLWKTFCDDHGFIYVGKPATFTAGATPETVKRLIFKPTFVQDSEGETRVQRHFSKGPLFEFCRLHNRIPINAYCDVYLCCIYWNGETYKIANYFNTSLHDIQIRRFSHGECLHCVALRKSK